MVFLFTVISEVTDNVAKYFLSARPAYQTIRIFLPLLDSYSTGDEPICSRRSDLAFPPAFVPKCRGACHAGTQK